MRRQTDIAMRLWMVMTMISSLGVAGSFWGAFTCRVFPSGESEGTEEEEAEQHFTSFLSHLRLVRKPTFSGLNSGVYTGM